MYSKAELIVKYLSKKRVLDIGGSGFGGNNAYEVELAKAWRCVANRVVLDKNQEADIVADLDKDLPSIRGSNFDITTAFDVLEHLESPLKLLRWVPTEELAITLPNAVSSINRWMESKNNYHLYSFTAHTARSLLERAGYNVEQTYFIFGKWSILAKLINCVGSIAPAYVATGLFMYCRRRKVK